MTEDDAMNGGCSVPASPASAPSGTAFAALAFAWMAVRRRRS
jgi:MYXO-CTERM domain-containing protein